MSFLTKNIGQRIKELRKNLRPRLTQDSLAIAIGVDKNTIWRWEKGMVHPEPANIEALCQVLKVTPLELMGGPLRAPPSPTEESLIEALGRFQKENALLKSENQQLREMLGKIPAEWIGRLAVKSRDDFGAIAARAFLTGDVSEVRSLRLPKESQDFLTKLLERNGLTHLP